MIRKLRAEKTSVEQELAALKNSEKDRMQSQNKHWEQTCEDLMKELTNAHGELADRDQATKSLETELKRMASQSAEVVSQKTLQQRRIESLNVDLRIL